MERKFNVATIILMALLVIRVLGQMINVLASLQNVVLLSVLLLMSVLYLASLIGICLKQKWGAVLVIVVAVTDLLSAAALGGAQGLGAAVFDLPLMFLGYKEYKQL